MALEIFQLFGSVTLKGDDKVQKALEKTLKKAGDVGKGIRKVGVGMSVAGAAITGAAVATATSWAKAGDEIEKMSRRTGFAVETLSELKHAAELSGTTIDSVEKGSKKLARTITEAAGGMKEYEDALMLVGLTSQELVALSPEEQFLKVAEALAEVEDFTVKAAAAQDLFGKAGTQLLPMLEDGAEGMNLMRQEARDLGIVFTDDTAKAAAKFQDDLLRLQGSLKSIVFTIGEQLFPVFEEWMIKGKEIILNISTWIKENNDLFTTITQTTLVIGGLLSVLGPLAIVFGQLLIMLPLIASGITILKTAINPTTGIIIAAATAISLLVSKMAELKKAIQEQEDAQGLQRKGQKENMSIMKEAFTLQKQFTVEQLKAMEDTGAAMEIAKQISQGYFTSVAVAGRTLTAEQKAERREIAEAYGAFYAEATLSEEGLTETTQEQSDARRLLIEDQLAFENASLEDKISMTNKKLAAVKKGTDEEAKLLKQLNALEIKLANSSAAAKIANIQEFASQAVATFQSFYDFKSVEIQNDRDESIKSESDKYDAAKKHIIATVEDEDEQRKQLLELEEGFQATKQNLIDDAASKERAARKKMKPLLIAEAIANTAVAFTKALPNIFLAGMIGAAGAFQVAKISAQKFARGTDFVVPNGFENDSFPMMVESGERVKVTPRNEVGFEKTGGQATSLTLNLDMPIENLQLSPDTAVESANIFTDALRNGVSEVVEMAKEIGLIITERKTEA